MLWSTIGGSPSTGRAQGSPRRAARREREDVVHARQRRTSWPEPTVARGPSIAKIGPWSRLEPHRVAVLALPGVIPLELGTATQVFGRDPHYQLTVCAEGRSAPVPDPGSVINTSAGLEGLQRAETVIVPGYEDIDATLLASRPRRPTDRACPWRPSRVDLHRRVRSRRGRAPRQTSAPRPTGAGPTSYNAAIPQVEVLPNRLFVDDGDILTSAGVTAGIDLCLHLIRRDHGAAAANTRARALVAPPQRQGGQAQFVERLRPEASGDQLGPLRDWMLENLDTSASTSTRSPSARTCPDEHSPAGSVRRPESLRWLARRRTDRPSARAAGDDDRADREHRPPHGLGAPASVRAAFHRRIGTSPQEYRAVFHHRAPTT